jgi:hypothetical protein
MQRHTAFKYPFMKIRIKGNSLRYRLTRSDVDLLATKGKVTELIDFGSASLQYELEAGIGDKLSAVYSNNCITVYFPEAWIDDWINTDEVGFKQIMEIKDSAEGLYIVVEKDFTCLDNVSEDQSDNYPNPLMKKVYEHE